MHECLYEKPNIYIFFFIFVVGVEIKLDKRHIKDLCVYYFECVLSYLWRKKQAIEVDWLDCDRTVSWKRKIS